MFFNVTLFTPERNRILSNFVRMLSSLLIGIFLVRQLLSVGPNAYGLYAFAVTGFGVSMIIREVLRVTFVPFLSQSLSQNKPTQPKYRNSVQTIMSFALLFGICAIMLMILVTFVLPLLGFNGEHSLKGQIFFVLRALSALLMIIVYPLFLSILVQEKQVQQNILLTIERVIELVSIILTLYIFKNHSEYQTLMVFALFSFGLSFLFYLSVFLLSNSGPITKIYPKLPTRAALKNNWRQLSAGLKDVLGPLLYFRFDLIFLTAIFGPLAALMLGLGVQFSGYIRQVNQVLIAGLDARFARASFSEGGSPDAKRENLRNIFSSVSRLQGLVIFYLTGFLVLFLPELLELWLGDRLDNSPAGLDELTILIFILVPGIASNTLAQSWIIMQTGAGKLQGFVNYILSISVLNPTILVAFILMTSPDLNTAIFSAAALYSILNTICFMGIIPVVIARQLDESPIRLWQPLLGPLFASVATITFVQLGIKHVWHQNIIVTLVVFLTGALISAAYFLIYLPSRPSNKPSLSS